MPFLWVFYGEPKKMLTTDKNLILAPVDLTNPSIWVYCRLRPFRGRVDRTPRSTSEGAVDEPISSGPVFQLAHDDCALGR